MKLQRHLSLFLVHALILLPFSPEQSLARNVDWPVYLGDKSAAHYSEAAQITPENVSQLRVAWTFDGSTPDQTSRGGSQCNPLIVDGILYGVTAGLEIVALDATTGELRWRLDLYETLAPEPGRGIRRARGNRGLAWWSDGEDSRILYATSHYLFCINPKSGRLIRSFGDAGKTDLKKGLGREIGELAFGSTSPGVVFDDLIIMGSTVSESLPAAPGHIRAFNVRTGEQVWRFNTIPHPGEFGHETWPEDAWETLGGANAWAGLTVDDERGLVYCPTGSATFDFYGGNRLGQNLFANTLLCLNARTGERVWHYQITHHDLLDYDLPAPPNLLTVKRDGQDIPAVAQLTKQGYVFVFNRVTGEPLFPIEERPVPQSDMPGEESWPTQPIPVKPAPFVRVEMPASEVTDITPELHAEVLAKYNTIRPHAQYAPGNLDRDTIVLPAMIGGGEWGGGATDPNGIMYFNANEQPALLTMIDTADSGSPGESVYRLNCIACHGENLEGSTTFGQVVPSLIGISDRKDPEEIAKAIMQGGAVMPPFAHLSGKELHHLLRYLKSPGTTNDVDADNQGKVATGIRFLHTGNRMWYDSKGYPAIKPPWGTMNALDLNTGEYLWKTTFGEYPELIEQGIPPTGRQSWGGPLATAGGVLFIAANLDGHIRGYDMKTGEEIWKFKLPAGGFATPATYMVADRQFIVIACGGGRGTPESDLYVTFALP